MTENHFRVVLLTVVGVVVEQWLLTFIAPWTPKVSGGPLDPLHGPRLRTYEVEDTTSNLLWLRVEFKSTAVLLYFFTEVNNSIFFLFSGIPQPVRLTVQ